MYKAISHKAISHLGNQVKSEYWCILTGTSRGVWLKTKIFQLFGQQSLYDIMNWHTYGNSWEKTVLPAVVGQHLEVACWQISTTGRTASFTAQGFYHPRDRKTWVQISNNGLTRIKQLLRGGLCHHTQTTCALVKSARVSGCRSVPALPTIGLSGIKHVNNYWKNCHNIWDAQGSQRGKPIFNDVTIPLQALPISMRERFLVWWQLLNCICCDPVYGRFGSDLSVSVRVTRQHFFLTLHQFKGRILSAKQVERRWVWRLK